MFVHIALWAGLVYACHSVRSHFRLSLLCVTFWLKGPKCLDDIQSVALQSKSESLSLKRIFKPGLFSPNPPTPFVAPVTPGRGRTFMSEDVVSSGC